MQPDCTCPLCNGNGLVDLPVHTIYADATQALRNAGLSTKDAQAVIRVLRDNAPALVQSLADTQLM